MKTLVLGLSMVLCACTTQQYAEFNQRANDSIANVLGTRTDPPIPPEGKSEAALDSAPAPVPSAQERADLAYANHIVGMGLVPKVTFTEAPPPKHPTAGHFDLVDGAVICSSYDLADFLAGEINKARHARQSLSPELRRQAALINGYDYGAEPRPSDYGCVLAPTGTPLKVEEGNYVPVVSGIIPSGQKFKGVTIPTMIDR